VSDFLPLSVLLFSAQALLSFRAPALLPAQKRA